MIASLRDSMRNVLSKLRDQPQNDDHIQPELSLERLQQEITELAVRVTKLEPYFAQVATKGRPPITVKKKRSPRAK